MAVKLNKNDLKLLSLVAEYRILTVAQFTILAKRNKRSLQRRIKFLVGAGFACTAEVSSGRRGRPERLISLSAEGCALLRNEKVLGPSVPDDRVTITKLRFWEHQLLTNWFRIGLAQIPRVIPNLSTEFLSPTSQLLEARSDEQSSDSVRVSLHSNHGEPVEFVPDGVFLIMDKGRQKALLFFLEVDMGTETLVSADHDHNDIRQKILNYQAYFKSGLYKRYEQSWGIELNGFRLLFLAHSASRLTKLGKLVQATVPSDFIWLTDQDRIFSKGVSANIWVRGGKIPDQSILGKKSARLAPFPSNSS